MVPRGFVKASELAPACPLRLLVLSSKPIGREFAAKAPAEDFFMMHASAIFGLAVQGAYHVSLTAIDLHEAPSARMSLRF